MGLEDCRVAMRVAEWNTQGRRRLDEPDSTWKDGIWDCVQRRNRKDEDCFDQKLWREKEMCVFWMRNPVL
jgi:hypothetical protein